MTGRGVRRALVALFVLGGLARLVAWRWEPPLHPDEFFQYLEPAWMRLQGVGVGTWEWRDGLRSWVLPGYHGAWMRVFTWLGLRDGGAAGRAVQLHWALVSTTLIWAAWRAGRAVAVLLDRRTPHRAIHGAPQAVPTSDPPPSGWQGGLLAALLCALFPLLVTFSVHTLSELPAMLAYVMAMALVLELCAATIADPSDEPPAADPSPRHTRAARRTAGAAGLLLGLATGLRIANAPLAVVPVLALLVGPGSGRRRHLLLPLVLGGVVATALFTIVDALTWGGFLSSFVAYVRFNFLEGGAKNFGVFPRAFYLERLLQRLPLALPLVAALALAGVRATWPLLVAAVGLVGYLSTQGHKEERFAVVFWPLMLIAAGATAGSWLAQLSARRRAASARSPSSPLLSRFLLAPLLPALLGLLLPLVALGDGARHFTGYDFALKRGTLDAQAWAGRQPDITGLLVWSPLYTGGYLWFGRSLPQATASPVTLTNPLFSHVLAETASADEQAARQAGFTRVHETGGVVVLRRAAAPAAPAAPPRP